MNLKFNKKLLLIWLQLLTITTMMLTHMKRKGVNYTSKKLRTKINQINRALNDYLNKAREDMKVSADKDIMQIPAFTKNAPDTKGIIMRVEQPQDAKPVYFNMSPMYDFRNYLI